jgi:DNA-binding NarL/FixJ family response regulator
VRIETDRDALQLLTAGTTVAGNSATRKALCKDRTTVRPTLLIVDDHADFRASARSLLELEGFDVIGLAEDGEAALEAVERLAPDVVLLDIQLPGLNGFEVAAELAARANPPRIVLVSSRDRTAYAAQLRGAPVVGFLGKGELSGAALLALVA